MAAEWHDLPRRTLVIVLYLTSSFAPVIITTATRGRRQTGNINIGGNKLFSQSFFSVEDGLKKDHMSHCVLQANIDCFFKHLIKKNILFPGSFVSLNRTCCHL